MVLIGQHMVKLVSLETFVEFVVLYSYFDNRVITTKGLFLLSGGSFQSSTI